MINCFEYRYTAVVIVLLLLCVPCYASDDKTSELRQKLTEIASLKDRLSAKIEHAIDKRDRLKHKLAKLKDEINEQKQQQQIESFQKACDNSRIDYNLKLIQLLSKYIAELNKKIVYFQNGNETLDYFSQHVHDDLLMIKTLYNLETDKLLTKINSVLDEYVLAAGKPMFDVVGTHPQDTEKIWDQIIQTN